MPSKIPGNLHLLRTMLLFVTLICGDLDSTCIKIDVKIRYFINKVVFCGKMW